MLDRLELLTVFAAAAKASSFRDAARRLGVSPQVVTRAIRELEQRLGETLFHRNTRRVQITATGNGSRRTRRRRWPASTRCSMQPAPRKPTTSRARSGSRRPAISGAIT
ncbi:helix-turn-helix domain-containing protein [Burkholderia gladioli]|uniref:helix-turn-helix domain-containing protein n=1 Tax=Burkholderia gladioli TaxID=28095 RepID=UPI003C7A1B35